MIPKGSGSENNSLLQDGDSRRRHRRDQDLRHRLRARRRRQDLSADDRRRRRRRHVRPVRASGQARGDASARQRTAPTPKARSSRRELSAAVNMLGVGPQGLGGDSTAFAVHVELAATHITMNPVAVNMQCHSARRAQRARSRQPASTTASERADRRDGPPRTRRLPITEAQVARAARRRHGHAAAHAVRHPRRDADPHVRPRPHDALRPARPRGDPHRAQRASKVAAVAANPAGYAPVCVGTTTSDAHGALHAAADASSYGVRIIIGKGGLGASSLAAFRELGGAYLAIIGGTAALETTWIEAIEDVDLDDLNPESLWQFRIRDFGPLLVAMDSHGGSLYDDGRPARRAARRAAALAALGVSPLSARLMRTLQHRHPDPRRGRRRPVRRAARARGRSRAVDHHRGEGPARQVRLHAHGPGRLQRRARAGRFGRAPLHGHDRGRQVAARPGPRVDAGHRRDRAHPRAGERARLLLRPQSRRHRPPEGVRRPDLRPHRAQGRPHRHRDHQPARRAGVGARHRAARGASRGRAHCTTATARARRRADDRHAQRRIRVRAGAAPCCSPPAAGRRCTATTRRPATRAATAWRWRCAPACRCATWRWCSSIRRDCSPARTRA